MSVRTVTQTLLMVRLATCPMPTAAQHLSLPQVGSAVPDYAGQPMDELTIASNMLYAVTGGGLAVFDVSRPTNPMLIGGWASPDYPCAVQVAGNYAFVGVGSADIHGGFVVLDIRDPSHPLPIGFYETPDFQGRLCVSGGYAYLMRLGSWTGTNSTGILDILNLDDPPEPMLVASVTTSVAGVIRVMGNTVYVAGHGFLDVIDTSNPAAPVRRGVYHSSQNTEGFHVNGHHAYLAGDRWTGSNNVGNLEIVDVTNPAQPLKVSSRDTVGYTHNVFAVGNFAYLAGAARGIGSNNIGSVLEMFDVSDPAHPTLAATYQADAQAYGICVDGAHIYLAINDEGLRVIQVSALTGLKMVGEFNGATFASDVRVVGGHAFLAKHRWPDYLPLGSLEIYDASAQDPLLRKGYYATSEQCNGVFVTNNLAYLAVGTRRTGTNDPGALEIVDISDLSNPKQVGTIPTRGRASRVRVSDRFAFVTEDAVWTGSNMLGALQIFSVSNPTNPILVATFDTVGSACAVEVVAGQAYLADGTNDLLIVDVSDPTNPTRAGSFTTNAPNESWPGVGGPALDIAVASDHVLSVGDDGLHILSVASPEAPLPINAALDPPFYLTSVAAAGRFAFVGAYIPNGLDPSGGLFAVDLIDPIHPVYRAGLPAAPSWFPAAIWASGETVYVAAGNGGLRVFSVASDPMFKSISHRGDTLKLTWDGAPWIRLERSDSLTEPVWLEVPGSTGQSSFEERTGGASGFFRLVMR